MIKILISFSIFLLFLSNSKALFAQDKIDEIFIYTNTNQLKAGKHLVNIIEKKDFLSNYYEPSCQIKDCDINFSEYFKVSESLWFSKAWLPLASWVSSSMSPSTLSFQILGIIALKLEANEKAQQYFEKSTENFTNDNFNESKYLNNTEISKFLKEKLNGLDQYESIKFSNKKEILSKYLIDFPYSKYKNKIADRIKYLEENMVDEWKTISESNDTLNFIKFIEKYPNSLFSRDARQKIDYINAMNSNSIDIYFEYLDKNSTSQDKINVEEKLISEASKKIFQLNKILKCSEANELHIKIKNVTTHDSNFDYDECNLNFTLLKNKEINSLLVYGMKFESSGKNDLAIRAYEAIIDNFPSHNLTIKAAERLIFLKEKIQANIKSINQENDNKEFIEVLKNNKNQINKLEYNLLKKYEENKELIERNKISESSRNRNICLSARQTCLNSCPKNNTRCTNQCGYCN